MSAATKKTSDFSIIEPYPAAAAANANTTESPTISIEPVILPAPSEESTQQEPPPKPMFLRIVQQTLDSNLEVMTDLQNRMNGMDKRLCTIEMTTQSIIKDFATTAADMNKVNQLKTQADEMQGKLANHQNEINNMQNVMKDVFDILYDKK